MLDWVKMVKGIKQGCPMSPMLFAIYMQMVTIALRSSIREREDEPCMLLYADDMVVWADTEEELKTKLECVMSSMASLGLRLNTNKMELQHNCYVRPSKEGKMESFGQGGDKIDLKYLPIGKPIRYLGAWTTADHNSTHGLEVLKEK